ncbi:uncharacterized protein at4g15545 [Phtheirospermum japonicum]|uniref:Uncharacterized protein at4g15545 n=1 Tax=Phtheirospermum japonicum TaxID=374723 RepID=A0A830BSV6_9LAMI|nr:uncharacterized protein at4g15545 [Phtheirospermum japonicum]
MANGGGDSNRAGPDFNLPDEILSVIPTDPYDQLDLARKITSMAIASRVTKLETETGRLRQKLLEKDRLVEELEEKVSQLEGAYQDAELRLKITREDNMKLSKERDSLASTTKKLSRDLAKLETFKRQLMQSLNEDNSPQAETVDIGTYDQTVPKAYSMSGDSNGYTKHHSYSGSNDSASINDDASKQGGLKFSITPYITPRLTPTGTPKVISTSVSPRRYSSAGSPQKASGATTPTKLYEGQGSISSWYPSSQQSSAANSPPRGRLPPGRTPRIDGKEFFRQARSRLSLEQFSAFLANIKELNSQRQSRELVEEMRHEAFEVNVEKSFDSRLGHALCIAQGQPKTSILTSFPETRPNNSRLGIGIHCAGRISSAMAGRCHQAPPSLNRHRSHPMVPPRSQRRLAYRVAIALDLPSHHHLNHHSAAAARRRRADGPRRLISDSIPNASIALALSNPKDFAKKKQMMVSGLLVPGKLDGVVSGKFVCNGGGWNQREDGGFGGAIGDGAAGGGGVDLRG